MIKLAVIDYDSGNLRSVAKALELVGVNPLVTGNPDDLAAADAVIFPGVGSAPAAMHALRERGLVQPLRDYVASGRPFLGVCLGLQLLMDSTEEGDAQCLGIIPGVVRRLPQGIKVPHMGWNSVTLQKPHPVFDGIAQGSFFYFVHSYYAVPSEPEGEIGATQYEVTFCSVYARGNLIATQFHPEKSGDTGTRIYKNFCALAEEHAADLRRKSAVSL